MPYNPSILVRTIDFDAPCHACRYNLRGLNSRGACPECGVAIADSLIKIEDARARAARSMSARDPAWVGAMLDGAVALVSAGAMLMLIGASRPRWAFLSLPRGALFVIACTALILEWFGAWKLTTRDRLEMPSFARIVARVSVGAFLAWVLIQRFIERLPETVILFFAIPMVLIATLGVGCFWLHVRRLAVIAGSSTLPVYATFLIALAPLWFFASMAPRSGAPGDSLSLVTSRASLVFGSAEQIVRTPRLTRFGEMNPFTLTIASVPLVTVIACAHLLIRIVMARRTQRKAAMSSADAQRSSVASSPT